MPAPAEIIHELSTSLCKLAVCALKGNNRLPSGGKGGMDARWCGGNQRSEVGGQKSGVNIVPSAARRGHGRNKAINPQFAPPASLFTLHNLLFTIRGLPQKLLSL